MTSVTQERGKKGEIGGERKAKMATDGLMTAGKMAEALGAPAAKVKKAIADLKIKPAEKKGACCYYDAQAVAKVKKAIG